MNNHVKEIIKQLDKITASGQRQSTIFEDWVEIVQASLGALPNHLRSAIEKKEFAKDTPETKKLFKHMKECYPKEYCWDAFAKAFSILIDSTTDEVGDTHWEDTLGLVYMEWGHPNKWRGQFFTPYHVAKMMAQITMGDIEEQIYQRLEEAYLQTPAGKFHQLMWPERVAPFVRKMGVDMISLCAEYIQPITVNDCCCGSGVMLLAAAEQTPLWALDWELVTFSGVDIDQTCVRMAQINMMLYGLNGFNLQCALELSKAELAAIPDPYRTAYEDAQENPDQAKQIESDIRQWKQESLI